MCREGQSCCNISFETENLVNITNFLTQLVTSFAKTGKREKFRITLAHYSLGHFVSPVVLLSFIAR